MRSTAPCSSRRSPRSSATPCTGPREATDHGRRNRIVRLGLIGAGGITRAHLRGYTAIPELVKRADVDAVDICLPHHLHAGPIVTAANAGKHVLCEKPLCLTAAEADAVRRAVADNDMTVMCAHNQLFMPAVAKTRELLDPGRSARSTNCGRPTASARCDPSALPHARSVERLFD